jgi:hypothetical protein
MRNRIEAWYDKLFTEYSESDIAAGLCNGDISTPEWMGKSEDVDHIKIWDTEDGKSASWGFIQLAYEDSQDDN